MGPGRRPQPWTDGLPALQRSFGLDDVAADLRAAGQDAVIVVQTVASAVETRELLALAAAQPLVAGVVGWADLARPDVAGQLEAARSGPGGQALVAVRHQLQEEPDPGWLARPQVRDGLRAVAAAGLAYDLVISPHQLPLVTETVAGLPEVRFVLDHAGKPPIAAGDLSAWRADLRALAALPNVAVKLSGLVTEADWDSWTPGQLAPRPHAGPNPRPAGSDLAAGGLRCRTRCGGGLTSARRRSGAAWRAAWAASGWTGPTSCTCTIRTITWTRPSPARSPS